MPFQWKETKEQKLIAALHRYAAGKTPFSISFNNFSCFPPKVIYIDIMPAEALTMLQQELHRFCKKELNLYNAQYRNLPFHPHLTLAFRDLKKDTFAGAWNEFKEKKFAGEFPIDKITLLKHDGKHWNLFQDFHF